MTGDQARTPLGKWMENRATDLNLSWEELAERAHMTAVNLRRIRKGGQEIPPRTRRRLDSAFQVASGTVDALLSGRPLPKGEVSLPPSRQTWLTTVLDRYEEIEGEAGKEAADAYLAGAIKQRRSEERRSVADQQESRDVS